MHSFIAAEHGTGASFNLDLERLKDIKFTVLPQAANRRMFGLTRAEN